MSEVSSEAVVVAVTAKVKSNYFKWTSEMENQLAKAVCVNKAHMKSKLAKLIMTELFLTCGTGKCPTNKQ